MAVAYSAGRDSTALLHATAHAARTLGIEVVALHVHHGLMSEADAWLALADEQVARWRKAGLPVRLLSTRLQGQPARGESVEAWARRERRAALARMACEAGVGAILLAHHRRDQAETVLLQALRGAGPPGLAAMPRAVEHDGLWWLRPWLEVPRAAIEAYVRRYRLRFVDDASNADLRFARARLRLAVWPALLETFPDAEVTLGAVARRAHEAQGVLGEVAEDDLSCIVDDQARLDVARWLALSAARRANALRTWLHGALGRGAAETLVERLRSELPDARDARWPADRGRELVLYRGRLAVRPVHPARGGGPPADLAIDLSRPGLHALPRWCGALEIHRVQRDGVPATLLKACRVVTRRGGEQWQAQARSTPRSLKKQYQAAGIPAGQRDGPLVYAGERLVFVPGLGLDARVRSDQGGNLLSLRWRADSPEAADPRDPSG